MNKQETLQMRNAHTSFLYNHLKTSPAAEQIRSSMKAVFGSGWTNKHMGF